MKLVSFIIIIHPSVHRLIQCMVTVSLKLVPEKSGCNAGYTLHVGPTHSRAQTHTTSHTKSYIMGERHLAHTNNLMLVETRHPKETHKAWGEDANSM